jgi:hypothetical protein
VITGGGTGLTYAPTGAYCNNPPGTTPDTFTYTLNGSSTASVSLTVTCDTTGPTITFDSVPPASWPVNYFDMAWHADEPASYECSLNGAAFTACTSPTSVTTSYDVLSSFAVRGKDSLNNLGSTQTTTWTSNTGLVLHYAWEQGALTNSSLLAQRSAYSPGASVGPLPAVGGWAGTALRSPSVHSYTGTARPLASSANGQYMAGMWIRPYETNAAGTLWSNKNGTTAGHEVLISGTTITLNVFEGGSTYTVTGNVPTLKWSHVGVRTAGPGQGLSLLINGIVVGTAAAPTGTGFGAGQATLTVGPVSFVDVDDLRFYNTQISTCTFVRGVLDAFGQCVPGRPAIELDFEGGRIDQTGFMTLGLQTPAWSPYAGATGDGLTLNASPGAFSLSQFSTQASTPGHTISLWTVGQSPADTLFDFTRACAIGSPQTCGIKISWTSARQFAVEAGTSGVTTSTTVPSAPLDTGSHNLVVAEQRSGGVTTSLRLYVDGTLAATVPMNSGDVFAVVNDTIQLPTQAGTSVDEIELWPMDLSSSPDMLCENGFDGEFNPATDDCTLTSN